MNLLESKKIKEPKLSWFRKIGIIALASFVCSLVVVEASTTIGNSIYTSSDLTVDGTSYLNGNVGIGTTNPTYKLSVQPTVTDPTYGSDLSPSFSKLSWSAESTDSTANLTGLTVGQLYQVDWGTTSGTYVFNITLDGTLIANVPYWGNKSATFTASSASHTLVFTPRYTITAVITAPTLRAVTGGQGGGAIALLDSAGNVSNQIRSFSSSLSNTSNGLYALKSNTTGYYNTANGVNALRSNTTGYYNTANGVTALRSNTTGHHNTANGSQALYSNTTGWYNTANGMNALYSNTTGNHNTANGRQALHSNTTGYWNTANGMNALYSNTTGHHNTANGMNAGRFISGGGANQTSASSTYIGYDTRASADGNTNETVIGHSAIGNGSNSVTLGNDDITKTILKGNVGIGITSPSSALEVNGNIVSRGNIASYPADCPANYIPVPGNQLYGTEDGFCVMKYEARNIGGTAVSISSGSPRVSVNMADAQTACQANGPGYHLITNDEWMTIARNIENVDANWSGGSVGSGKLKMGNNGINEAGVSYDGAGPDTGIDNNLAELALSNQETIWHFSGNVWSWVDQVIISTSSQSMSQPHDGSLAEEWVEFVDLVNYGALTYDDIGPANRSYTASFTSNHGIGKIYTDNDCSFSRVEGNDTCGVGDHSYHAFHRGGDWGAGVGTGVFSLSLSVSPSYFAPLIGFRCVR